MMPIADIRKDDNVAKEKRFATSEPLFLYKVNVLFLLLLDDRSHILYLTFLTQVWETMDCLCLLLFLKLFYFYFLPGIFLCEYFQFGDRFLKT